MRRWIRTLLLDAVPAQVEPVRAALRAFRPDVLLSDVQMQGGEGYFLIRAVRALPAEPPIDIAFIDADKTGYRAYYDEIVARLRPGGLVLLDNVLWSGAVADAADRTVDTQAIRALNAKIHRDERVSASMVPVGDGLFLARKR